MEETVIIVASNLQKVLWHKDTDSSYLSSTVNSLAKFMSIVFGRDAWHILAVSDMSFLALSICVTGSASLQPCLSYTFFCLPRKLMMTSSLVYSLCYLSSFAAGLPFLVRPIIIRSVLSLAALCAANLFQMISIRFSFLKAHRKASYLSFFSGKITRMIFGWIWVGGRKGGGIRDENCRINLVGRKEWQNCLSCEMTKTIPAERRQRKKCDKHRRQQKFAILFFVRAKSEINRRLAQKLCAHFADLDTFLLLGRRKNLFTVSVDAVFFAEYFLSSFFI